MVRSSVSLLNSKIAWKPPPLEFLKLNVDGAVSKDGLVEDVESLEIFLICSSGSRDCRFDSIKSVVVRHIARGGNVDVDIKMRIA
ncbi:hypothetical protein V6N11_027752 [Hibiscus sabdariffa]|uniref:Uncharacterized protein n=2 Tax=Hibiscus sabdariffa TaxID=183260 RepID=A0ABR2NU83_9ROSI